MGTDLPFFLRKNSRRRLKKAVGLQSPPSAPPPPPLRSPELIDASNNNNNTSLVVGSSTGPGKGKKKAGGTARLWMRFDRLGNSELVECDKSAIIKPREKAMVVNLEFIRAIVTAEEVLILDPLCQEVLPFVDQLRQQLPHKTAVNIQQVSRNAGIHASAGGQWLPVPEAAEGLQCELPFEFHVLEIALEVVCTYLDSNVADLERDAYPVLDELARNVSTKNLEHVRSLKSNLTRLLARVQKVRDEIEHLLDDNEDMADLYLTRRWIQNQQSEALVGSAGSNSITLATPHLRRLGSNWSASMVTGSVLDDDDVEDLEMLLEAYFMQLDGTRNKILSVREYIDDTEDYVNIQLDNQRNELIQLQLILTIASFAIAVDTLIAGMFGMNIPCQLYQINGIFGYFVGSSSTGCLFLFLLVLGYARWKKLLGSSCRISHTFALCLGEFCISRGEKRKLKEKERKTHGGCPLQEADSMRLWKDIGPHAFEEKRLRPPLDQTTGVPFFVCLINWSIPNKDLFGKSNDVGWCAKGPGMGQSTSSCSSSNGHEIYRPTIVGKSSSIVDGDDDLTLSLPDECLGSVFGKLGCLDRNSCSLVCKRWKCVDSKSRNRLVLLARSEMSPCLPSLLSRFNTVSILSLKCSRKLLSIDDAALSRVPIFLPYLKKLKLKGCIHISDDGLHAFSLHHPPFLTKLSFASCGFGAKGLNSLLSNCPSLQDLTLKRLRKLDATSSTPSSLLWAGALNAGGDDVGNDHHNSINAIVAGDAKREKDVHNYCYKRSLRLERLCLKDLHNARLFIPLILSASASIKTLIVCRSSGNWDRVLETSLHGKTTSISEIQMDNVQMGDAGLLAISSSCPDLQLLYLSRTTDCTDDGLSAIANSCKKLRKLHVDAWSRFGSRTIGDEGVFSIANKCSQLQELVLMGIPIAIRSLNALASNCLGLERMALCNTDSVQDSEMAFIASKFLALKKLCIKNCPNVSKSGIEAVGRGCPNLVKLKVKRCKGVTQAMVSRLRFQRSSLVVSVDAGSMLFDSEGISLLASSVNEDEQGTATALTNPNSARSAAAPTAAATHVICSSRGALLLRSKFGSALQLGRRRRPIEDSAN
ncbi:hypothetical protein SADUNF_Sadunf06G0062400 [Salix dunnii]|uniref:F-box domain-containing protein n=1 Tax=Salix dunnii TaxID=1413687 RepID=A0A835K2V8_9ROSI|nr:hypothetical protein SADUNF_Sadunf06G0062400 [Salix dunnii]